jgi:beta-lactamase regulating signal transducer with metallopeptidase domain
LLVHWGQTIGTGRIPTPPMRETEASPPFQTAGQFVQRGQTRVPAQTFGAPTPSQPVAKAATKALLPIHVAMAWITIAGVLSLLVFARQLLLRRWLRQKAKLDHSDSIAFYRADVSTPFCGGIFRPFVVTPYDFESLPPEEQEAVLLHEEAHIRFRHAVQRLLADIVIALFFWNPFAHLLSRHLGDLHEQQCDEAVIRLQGSGLSLAKGLVRFAERSSGHRTPAPTLSIIRRKSRLEGRVQRLIKQGGPSMPPKKQFVTLAAIAVSIAATALSLATQIGRDPVAESKAFMAYRPGTTRTYRYTDAGGRTGNVQITATSLQPNGPYPVMEFYRTQDKYSVYDYWMATDKGLVPVDHRYLTGEPGFSTERKLGARLPAFAKPGYEWTWSESFRGQVMMRPDGTPPPAPPPTQFKGKVLAVDQPVKVPFGTVKATVVEIQSDGSFSQTITQYWARNIGLVKTVYSNKDGKVARSEELVSITRDKR